MEYGKTMSQGADPLRMMYVGILTTLLLLTGCFGLVEDDVIDSTSGEVTDQQFSDLENRVFDVETLAASHTTDIADLDARVTLIESNMLTIADVMAALPPGVDLSDYLTSADIASLVSDAQTAQTAIQMSAADIAALEQDVADLEADLQALQNANPGAGGSSYPPLIEDFYIQIETPYYMDDGNLAELATIYPDALNQEVSVSVFCEIYDVEADSLDTVGLDIDHDGVIDETINTQWDSDLERYECDDQFWMDNADFNYETDDGGRIYMIAALGVEDATGAWSWDATYDYSYDIITYETWMDFQFTVADHPDTLGWDSYDDNLFILTYSNNNPGVNAADELAYGNMYDEYLSNEQYRVKVHVSSYDSFEGSASCWADGSWHTSQYDDCEASSGLLSGGTIYDGMPVTISENPYQYIGNNYQYNYNDMCQGDYYNDGHTCDLSIQIALYEKSGSGWGSYYSHLRTYTYSLQIS